MTATYEIKSAHWHRSVKQGLFQAEDARDALRQYIVSLSYDSPDLSEGYILDKEGDPANGQFLVVVENDEVFARLVDRPCTFCGHQVDSTNPDVDFCRDCFYAGRSHKAPDQLVEWLKAVEGVDEKSIGVWHTGGGCFAVGAKIAGDWELLATDTDGGLPDYDDDPSTIKWAVGLYDEEQSGWLRDDRAFDTIPAAIDELRELAQTAGARRDF